MVFLDNWLLSGTHENQILSEIISNNNNSNNNNNDDDDDDDDDDDNDDKNNDNGLDNGLKKVGAKSRARICFEQQVWALLLIFHQTHNLSRNKFAHVARQVKGFKHFKHGMNT